MHVVRILRSAEGLDSDLLHDELCTTWGFLLCWVGCFTLFTNGLIAINRALACYPYTGLSQKFRTRRAVLVTIAGTWIFFLGLLIIPVALDLESWNALLYCLGGPPEGYYVSVSQRQSAVQTAEAFLQAAFGLSGITTLTTCFFSYAAILHYLFCSNHVGSTSKRRRKEKTPGSGLDYCHFRNFSVLLGTYCSRSVVEAQAP